MSNRLLSAAWKLSLSATEKVVLAALADCADDEGVTWIAVRSMRGKLDLLTMTSLSERSIQGAIKSLTRDGHLSRSEQPGRGCTYIVHPRTTCAPASPAPPQEMRPAGDAPAPAGDAGEPSITPQASPKASPSPKVREPKRDPFPCPEGVDPTHWRDLLANRKSKRLTNTPTAHKRLLSDLAKLADDEWPPGRLVEHAAERGWGAIFDPRERQHGGRFNGQGSRSGHGRTVDAAIEFAEGR